MEKFILPNFFYRLLLKMNHLCEMATLVIFQQSLTGIGKIDIFEAIKKAINFYEIRHFSHWSTSG